MSELENVLFVANTDTALNGFLIISKMLYCTDRYFPIILCEGQLQIEKLIYKNEVDKTRIKIVELPNVHISNYKNLFLKIYSQLLRGNSIFFAPFSIGEEIRKNEKRKKKVKSLIEEYKPKVLLVYTDRRGGYEQAAICLAKQYDIPIVIPSVSKVYFQQVLNNPNNGVRYSINGRLPLLYALAKRINDKWVVEYQEEYVFFHRAQELLAALFCGGCNKNPWMLGETRPTINANADIESYYETINMIGKEKTFDSLAYVTSAEELLVKKSVENKENVKEAINEKYMLGKKTNIIFSAVPYYEAGITTLEINQKIHKILIAMLSKQNANILVSMHPKMNKTDYPFIEEFENVVIIEESLRDVLCTADLFVVMEESATKQWGELLKLDMVTLPEKWFRLKDEGEIAIFFAELYDHVIKSKENIDIPEKLQFDELLLRLLEGEDVSKIIAEQFKVMNEVDN